MTDIEGCRDSLLQHAQNSLDPSRSPNHPVEIVPRTHREDGKFWWERGIRRSTPVEKSIHNLVDRPIAADDEESLGGGPAQLAGDLAPMTRRLRLVDLEGDGPGLKRGLKPREDSSTPTIR